MFYTGESRFAFVLFIRKKKTTQQ